MHTSLLAARLVSLGSCHPYRLQTLLDGCRDPFARTTSLRMQHGDVAVLALGIFGALAVVALLLVLAGLVCCAFTPCKHRQHLISTIVLDTAYKRLRAVTVLRSRQSSMQQAQGSR